MPRRCAVCDHENLAEINSALVFNEPLRDIADRWSVSKTDLMLHRNRHISFREIEAIEAEEEAKEAEEEARANNLLDQVRDLQERALDTLDKGEGAEELSAALEAIKEARDDLERSAELLDERDEHPQTNT